MPLRATTPTLAIALAALITASCGCPCPNPASPQPAQSEPSTPPRKPLPRIAITQQCTETYEEPAPTRVEIDGDLGVVRLSVDRFVNLTSNERKMAYEMMDAMRAADAIIFDQRHPLGLVAKTLAEELALHMDAIPAELRPKMRRLVQLVFAHKGPRNAESRGRLELPFWRYELQAAAIAAWRDGARFGNAQSEYTVRDWLEPLQPFLFELNPRPIVRKQPPIATRYAKQIADIAAALRRAQEFALPSQKHVLELQIAAIESNTAASRSAYLEAWSAHTFPIDLAMGFFGPTTESGEQEFVAHLFLTDPNQPAKLPDAVNTIRENHAHISPQTLSTRTPRIVQVTPLVMGTRSTSPVMPYPDSEPYKLFITPYANDATASEVPLSTAPALWNQLATNAGKRACNGALQTTLQLARAQVASPQPHPQMQSIARIHATAMVMAAPSNYVADGLLHNGECLDALGNIYLTSAWLSLGGFTSARASDASAIGSIIVSHAHERSFVGIVYLGGDFLFEARWPESWRKGMAVIRDETRDILVRNDLASARRFLKIRGTKYDELWMRGAIDWVKALRTPTTIVWQPPPLKPLRDERGNIQDVTLDDTASWIEASLAWMGRNRSVDDAAKAAP